MRLNLFQNLPLKILSVVLAFLIWVYFTGQEQIIKDIDLPLEINLAPDKLLLGEYSSQITVRVRGTETAIARLENRSIYSSIDLTDFPVGEKLISISAHENIHGLPPDLEVVSITPDRIKVTIERRVTKEIPILPNISGKPEDPFVYYGYDIHPHSIVIEGAENDVKASKKALTQVIDITGRKGSFRIRTDVIPDHPSVKIVNPKQVMVHVKIDKNIKEVSFKDIPLTFLHKEQLFTPSHEKVSLTIEGPMEILKKIDKNSIHASINLADLKPSSKEYLLAPFFDFPSLEEEEISRLTITSWDPENISIRIH